MARIEWEDDPVPLSEAIAHGLARHESAPFRIRKNRGDIVFEVGVPDFSRGGDFDPPEVTSEGSVELTSWHSVAEDSARREWPRDGWVLG